MSSTDRIEKQLVLKAPQAKVWRALTNVTDFNAWFRVNLEQPFAAGTTTRGKLMVPGYEHVYLEVAVDKLDAERGYFAYRWHPYAVDPKADYSTEPSTLVEFQLAEVPGGTKLTITESGFDKLPAHRRDEAFRMNSQGWEGQLRNIEKYVAT
jgi:uncharacterized protein YndB with AHSA1/START domain